MLNPYFIVDLIIVLAFILVGAVVILKDPKPALNRLFLVFTATISAWIIANYFSNDLKLPLIQAKTANHLALLFPGLSLIALLNFALIITKRRPFTKVWSSINIISAAIYILALTPLVMKGITKQDTVYAITFGPFSSLYFLCLVATMLTIVAILATGRKVSQGEERQRLTVILWGLSTLLAVNIATNALLPALGGSFMLTNIGPLSGAFLVFALWYSIVKHRLFDIRLVIARSLAYAASLVSLGTIFISSTFALTSLFFQDNNLNVSSTRWLYTFLAIILAFIFPPLKRFFDKVTEKLFFRDAYDTQNFLDQFNKILVSTYEVNPLLRKSAQIIEDNLKPTYTLFGIKETPTTPRKIIGTKGHPEFSENDISFVRALTPKMKTKLIITDALDDKYVDLRKTLLANNIAVIARLTSKASAAEEGTGYLILGPKKSGNLYSGQDLKVIEIITNELVIAVQNALHTEEIENFNITLQEKVRDATHRLRRSNEKLKALDETKDDFISMASHQLRTPLTSVKGYISMVLEEDAGKITATQRDMLGQAFFSSQRMVYLIADLLNVSRLKTGKFVMEPSEINLATMIEQEMQQLEETATAREVTLRFDKPAHFPDTMLDETKTRQVIMNFIDNAIYYTKAGGRIRVALTETDATIEMRVEDDGIGVPKHEQPHLFTKFYRAGNARQARPDGTGLGLFMARKVIVGQGGSVIFESIEGKGSTFGFVFSKAAVGVPAKVTSVEPAKEPELAGASK